MEDQENTEEIKSFEDLGQSENSENDMILPEKEVDDLGRSYATGKEKMLLQEYGLSRDQVILLLMENHLMIISQDLF